MSTANDDDATVAGPETPKCAPPLHLLQQQQKGRWIQATAAAGSNYKGITSDDSQVTAQNRKGQICTKLYQVTTMPVDK